AEARPADDARAPAGALELVHEVEAGGRPEEVHRVLEGTPARPAREPFVSDDLFRLHLHDGLEGAPEALVDDDLDPRVPLVPLPELAAQVGGGARVLDEAEDLALLVLERAPEREAV